jgi:UDP-glucuronate 4-epimerase
MSILVTGAAGFIGYHVAEHLLERGESVIGLDNLNSYYSVQLKKDRLALLEGREGFEFLRADLAEPELLFSLLEGRPLEGIVHLAAQPGVRHSLKAPFDYVRSNLTGHLAVLELARHREECRHLVYASSSSVYGGNTKTPFSVDDPVDRPVSLYAATKRADELMSQCYSHLYSIPQTGLRFFTVYGPWYRPDMALWKFAECILEGRPIRVFNHGDMRRDFTWIGDVVAGVVAALDRPPTAKEGEPPPHRIYNLGNHRSEKLLRYIEVLEDALGKKAKKRFEGMQPGDVYETYADIETSRRDLGYEPTTTIEEGVPRFAKWFRDYHSS